MRTDGPVVIATDFSQHSEQTVRWGVDAARTRHAAVLLVHSYRDPSEAAAWGWYPMVPDTQEYEQEMLTQLHAVRDEIRAREPGVPVEVRLMRGPVVPALRELSSQAQLLVLGAHGQGRRPGLGSISGQLVTYATCPVALVRTAHAAADAPVVVGVDGSRSSLVAARLAAQEAARRGRPLRVLHARPVPADPHGRGPAVDGTAHLSPDDPTHAAARAVADELHSAHPSVTVSLDLRDDDPVHALVEASREADLLVVGSRGLGAFRGLLLGAVSRDVVRAAHGVVLVVRDPD
ncbi:universal stress protein [Cellulomonas soli]|uniref:universal stress protein n=1 Tax=Cellulomonas soli TaxID=931535 RepID=UPI003F8378C3